MLMFQNKVVWSIATIIGLTFVRVCVSVSGFHIFGDRQVRNLKDLPQKVCNMHSCRTWVHRGCIQGKRIVKALLSLVKA